MGLAFVPIYIRYLGMEAYALVGVFAVMQAWLTLLDMGMTPTLGREMARFTAGSHSPQSIRNLLRTLEIVSIGIASVICFSVWAASAWLAGDWLRADRLPVETIQTTIAILAPVLAFRFIEGIYRSALFGLQRQVWFNAVSATLATLRSVGAVIVLAAVSPSVQAFFLWQALVSLISMVVFALGLYRGLPRAPAYAAFSSEALLGVWRFASGMIGITLLVLLLTQIDKVLLSRLLPLEAFGYYTLAATVAGALYLVVTPVTAALYPRLVELVSRGDPTGLVCIYHRGATFVTLLTAPLALVLGCFSEGVLFTWSGNPDLATHAGPILSALTIGTFLNGLMFMPYHLQLAHGWTSLTLRINAIAVLLLVPTIFWVVPRYSGFGAACVWIVLNAGYVLVAVHLMHRRLVPNAKWRWYIEDVGLPTLTASLVVFLMGRLAPGVLANRIVWLEFLVAALIVALSCCALSIREVRSRLYLSITRHLLA